LDEKIREAANPSQIFYKEMKGPGKILFFFYVM